MKQFSVAAVLMAAALIGQVRGDEIDGKVIHHYNYVGVGYGFLHDVGGEMNAHGVVGTASFEEGNFLFGVSGGHFWGDDDLGIDADVRFWSVGPSVGYVVRLMENHLNIIPQFSATYAETIVDISGVGSGSGDAWAIAPGIELSYAFNKRVAINGGYAWGYNLDTEDDVHLFRTGLTFAIYERVGVSLDASFDENDGFNAITAGLEFHF